MDFSSTRHHLSDTRPNHHALYTAAMVMSYDFISGEGPAADLLQKYDTFLFDCDGVLWSGSQPINGAAKALSKLRQAGKKVVFVTNNSSQSRAKYLAKFKKMGIQANAEEIVSSA